MRPTLYTINYPSPGCLSTMAKPRGHDWLQDEMQSLHDHGVNVLVSTLPAAEAAEIGTTDGSTRRERGRTALHLSAHR